MAFDFHPTFLGMRSGRSRSPAFDSVFGTDMVPALHLAISIHTASLTSALGHDCSPETVQGVDIPTERCSYYRGLTKPACFPYVAYEYSLVAVCKDTNLHHSLLMASVRWFGSDVFPRLSR